MAGETDFGALTAANKRYWSAQIWVAGRDAAFWTSNGFVGEGTNSVIQRVTEITTTSRGDKVIMQLVSDMQQDGVVGVNELTGNEEALFNDSIEFQIDKIRHGTKNRGEMSEQKTVIKFRQTAREKLSFWYADKCDELMFLTASGIAYTYKTDGSTRTSSQLPQLAFNAQIAAPSSGRKMYAGTATSTATLTTADTMSWDLIVAAHSLAERKKLKPIRSGGRNYYAMLLSTEQARDLKRDSDYQSIVQHGETRGSDNPLFRGALVVVDGIVLYSHNKTCNTFGLASASKWGSGGTVDGAQALLMGSQALGYATVGEMAYSEADINDYGDKPGVAIGQMFGMLKPQFTSIPDSLTKQDFGLLSIYTAAAA